MKQRMNPSVVDMPAGGIRRVADAARAISGCISLTLGEPGFDTPLPIREAACRALMAGQTHYPPNAGLPALREAIARGEWAHYDAPLDAAHVLVTCGSTEALACALLATVCPGDEVIVPSPAFGLYAQQLRIAGGVHVPLDTAGSGFQIDPAALGARVTPRTKAVILNSPNNPTGVLYSAASLRAVAEVCLAHDLFLIFDAVYDHLCYGEGVPYPSLAALGERLIVCNAFSKTYAMTGWRVGYCVAMPGIIAELTKVHASLAVGVSTFSQAGCVDIYDVPTEAMRDQYRHNRDMVCDALAAMGMPCVRPDGAFYAFPAIHPWGMDDETFVYTLMREAKVALVPGSCFGAPGYVRLSYCCEADVLREGLRRLAGFVARL